MITLGFKNERSTYMRALIAFALGVVFIVFALLLGANAWKFVVKIAGVGSMLLGAVLVANALVLKGKSESKAWTATLTWMTSSGVLTVLMGIALFCFAAQIATFFALLVGILSLVAGLYQIVLLASTSKLVKVSPLLFILPCTLAICGAVVLLFWKKTQFNMVIGCMTGATFILYALADIVTQLRVRKILKQMEDAAEVEVVEVVEESEKADEQ